jgi:cell division FtsZ-interacting protein ZapD
MLYSLMKDTLDNRANAQTQAMQLEAQAIPQLLSLARENTSTGTTNSNNFSYGQSPQDYQIMLQALMNLY